MNARHAAATAAVTAALGLVGAAPPAQALISQPQAQANVMSWALHRAACYGAYWQCDAGTANCHYLGNATDLHRAAYYCHAYLLRSRRQAWWNRFLVGSGTQGCAGSLALSPIGVRFSSFFKCQKGTLT